jgi:hypothetical protein
VLVAPYTHVRIEPPHLTVAELRAAMPTLLQIELYPPAAGPEVELVFGTETTDAGRLANEHDFRAEVERITGRSVLALAVRG